MDGVVLQEQHPFFVGRRIQKGLFFVQCEQGTRVVTHDVRQRNVARAGKQVRHECQDGPVGHAKQRNHLAFGVTVGKKDIPPLDSEDILGHPAFAWNPLELAAFRKGQEVFGQKRRFL